MDFSHENVSTRNFFQENTKEWETNVWSRTFLVSLLLDGIPDSPFNEVYYGIVQFLVFKKLVLLCEGEHLQQIKSRFPRI